MFMGGLMFVIRLVFYLFFIVALNQHLQALEAINSAHNVPWKVAELKAKKFFIGSLMRIEASDVDVEKLAEISALLESHGDNLEPDAEVIHLNFYLSRPRSRSDTYIDINKNVALLTYKQRWGRTPSFRKFQYTSKGIIRTYWRPASKSQINDDVSTWQKFSSRFIEFPNTVPKKVIDPIAILYLLAKSGIKDLGDRFSFFVYENKNIFRLELIAIAKKKQRAKFKLKTAISTKNINENRDVLLVELRDELIFRFNDSDKDKNKTNFSQKFDITLDLQTRAPLSVLLKGVKIIKTVRFNLRYLELKDTATVVDYSNR